MSDGKRLGADPLAWIGPGQNAATASGEAGNQPPQPAAKAGESALAGLDVRREDKEYKAKLEKRLEIEQVCSTLDALSAGLRAGRLDLGREPGVWRLPVGRALDLELKISAKKDKARCALSLEWKIE
ncbi:MAG: amphi-Trp domain-containing protein [Desulfovibrionaceae bacterium]|nr:amphi-Trp domain-containing protein [Desulfovibrionaceae bacterium]MBF0514332.1 amphi-Trp domain-containing protein [Desulfovibrionaceae bacterium]